jgi:hypothetical protein
MTLIQLPRLYNAEWAAKIIMVMKEEGFRKILFEGTIPAFSFKDWGKTEHAGLAVML